MQRSIVIVEAASNGRWYARRARELGHLPVVVFPRLEQAENYRHLREHAYDYLLKYDPIIIDEPDSFETLVSLLGEHNPVCVAAGSELGVFLADKLARALGLPGNHPDSSLMRRDKAAMQDALRNKGLRHIRSGTAYTVDEALAVGPGMGSWPIVIKPLAGAGSLGVHFCYNEDELRTHAEALLGGRDLFGSVNKSVLVQEFIKGTEYIVNTASHAGRHILTDMWVYNKVAVGAEGNAYDCARLITRLEPGHASLVAYAFRALTAMGYEYGPSHMEIMVDTEGPVLIEAGARPMGADFPDDALRESLGHYIVDRALTGYLDAEEFTELEFTPYRPRKHMIIKYFIAPDDMYVDSAPAMPLIAHLPSVRNISYIRAENRVKAPKTVDLVTAPGNVLLCHKEESVLLEDYRLIRKIETSHFDMLFADTGSDKPSFNAELTAEALRNLIDYQDLAQGFLVVLDAGVVPPDLPGAEIISFDQIATLSPYRRYKRIALHNAHRTGDFSDYLSSLQTLTACLEPGGTLYCTPWGLQASGYGAAGMEVVFRLLGLSIEPPLSSPAVFFRALKE